MSYDCFKHGVQIFPSDLDVGACIFKENVLIDTFTILFESTQNKQQYGTKITCIGVRKRFNNFKNCYNFEWFLRTVPLILTSVFLKSIHIHKMQEEIL